MSSIRIKLIHTTAKLAFLALLLLWFPITLLLFYLERLSDE